MTAYGSGLVRPSLLPRDPEIAILGRQFVKLKGYQPETVAVLCRFFIAVPPRRSAGLARAPSGPGLGPRPSRRADSGDSGRSRRPDRGAGRAA